MRKKRLLTERDKTYAQREHFKKRLFERFGLTINRYKYKEIVDKIQNNQAKRIETQSRRLTLYLVEIQGIPVKVVYDHQRKTVVTTLTLDMDPNELMEIEELDESS